ncbi:hypothetical protein RND81_12G025100 [Saponaria officinalis]|uniref:Exostosin GT47 domain-containing protein n=1 Tax=Saponaria officinalis TaxID=3572 RepID=A0AAW1H758_SAPOF
MLKNSQISIKNISDNIHTENSDPCYGKYIYMHEIPPKFNVDLIKNCRKLANWPNFCPYFENNGFGRSFSDRSQDLELFTTQESWYETNQFMLSVIFHNRMKKYECLTKNSSQAVAIYAPFYAGLEVGRYLWNGCNLSIRDATAIEFTSWLRNQPEWGRVSGSDHFFVAGRITWDFRRLSNSNSNWGSKLLNLPESKNMTMLTIESSPYGNNDFAIPYPTYFHPSRDIEVFEWQERVRKSERRYLFSFGGAPRPNVTWSIRGELIRQCENMKRNRCNLVNCNPNDDMCSSPAHFIKTFMEADFCLQPPGDSHTRRSTFDSILAGCIPVFFHPGSAYIQYLWHFPKNYTKYSVFIPETGIKNGSVSVEEVLSKFSKNEKSAMRDEVIRLIPSIVYARNKLETIEDAFDLAVKGVLKRVEEMTKMVRDGKDPNSRFFENTSWKYYLTGDIGWHEWDSFF